jgi:cytochrome P450
MMLRYAAANCPSELNLTNFTARLSVSNTGSFHQASMAITNTLFNILDSDAEYSTINALREEAAAALSEHNGVWTKATAAQMTKMDSVCRETLRLHAFANRAVFKRVVADSLVTEDGITLPKGAMLSLLAQPAQTDPDVFEAPMTFDPFRFSRARESETTAAVANSESAIPSIVSDSDKTSSSGPPPHPPGKLPLISTSAINLPFAHGRHACPGRFIVDFEMKIMLAYLLMHYDIVVVKRDKPWREWAAEASMLVKGGKVSVRRRGTME